jgi:hypothetical protein
MCRLSVKFQKLLSMTHQQFCVQACMDTAYSEANTKLIMAGMSERSPKKQTFYFAQQSGQE